MSPILPSCRTFFATLLALDLLCCHPPEPVTVASPQARPAAIPDSEPLVAEAVLGETRYVLGQQIGVDTEFYLPVTIDGHPASLVLDTGTDELLLWPELLAKMGIAVPPTPPDQEIPMEVDSFTFGTVTDRHIQADLRSGSPFMMGHASPGLPPQVGIIGQQVLLHYDLVFDGPAKRVRLYKYPATTPAQDATQTSVASKRQRDWLPPGMTSADCTPITAPLPDGNTQSIQMMIKGQPLETWFDSGFSLGSGGAQLNEAAAKLLGIPLQNTGEQRVDIPIMIGSRSLILPRSLVTRAYDSIYKDRPFLQIGILPFRDRVLLVSNSTSRFCVSAPVQASVSH